MKRLFLLVALLMGIGAVVALAGWLSPADSPRGTDAVVTGNAAAGIEKINDDEGWTRFTGFGWFRDRWGHRRSLAPVSVEGYVYSPKTEAEKEAELPPIEVRKG